MKRVAKTVFFTIIILLFISVIAIDVVKFAFVEKIPENMQYQEITDERIDGSLRFYIDDRGNRYWLLHVTPERKKLIMYTADIRAYISINVIDDNIIRVYYDYIENMSYTMEDESFDIDLTNNQTYNISFVRRFVQLF
ncbi:MAG TPA: hypothetical protein VFD00_05825 [Thermoclostridium sp.]|nr:hypothetical protein [Thermoclostridium sp.]